MRKLVFATFLAILLLGCGEKSGTPDAAPAAADEPDDTVELTGKPRIVFVRSGRSQQLRIYFVEGRTAHLLDFDRATRGVGLPPIAETDGLMMDRIGEGVLLHSGATYRMKGRVEPVEPRDALLTFDTKRLAVEEIEQVEEGAGVCDAYPGVRVPPGKSGWVPVLPDWTKGKEGILVQKGLLRVEVKRMKVASKPEPILIPSIKSVGSIEINKVADWLNAPG